ncbi:hypothetical protein TNCV_3959071 [Trichonephila clavipes]|nr:hypothetical protein TNCV_3959071 [Trichonephila clavipes]
MGHMAAGSTIIHSEDIGKCNSSYMVSNFSYHLPTTQSSCQESIQYYGQNVVQYCIEGVVRIISPLSVERRTVKYSKRLPDCFNAVSERTQNEKFWKAIGNSGHCGPNPEAPGENRGYFPVMTFWEYDFDHWLGVAANEACPLWGHTKMDGDHLLQCIELDEYLADDIVNRYWETWRQMVKKPSTGVG